MDEFKQELEGKGVSCTITLAKDGKRGGISYAYEYEGQLHTFRGSSVNRQLSFGYILKAVQANSKAEAARIERANKNSYWNSYNTHYRPLMTDAKSICDKTYGIYNKYRTLDKECSREISEKYDLLRVKRAEMERMEDDIQQASLAEDIVTAVAALISLANPLLGIAIGLVGCIVAESDRKLSIDSKKDIRAEAAAIRDDIDGLKERQKVLRQNKTDALKAYVVAKEDRTELFAEMNKLRDELLKPVEAPKPKIQFDFTAAVQKSAQTQAPRPAQTAPASSTVNIYAEMMKARTREEFSISLLSKMVAVEPILDRFSGVSDFKVTLAREGRVTNASSLVSSEQLRSMLDKWAGWTGRSPAYKLAIEREHGEKLKDICRKLEHVFPGFAPICPIGISFRQEGSVQSVSFITSKGNEFNLLVDADNYIRWNNGSAFNINTGKYYEPRPRIQDESIRNTEQKGKSIR